MQWLEQADVYAAGALDGQELAGFEAHLADGLRDLRRADPRDARGARARAAGAAARCRRRPRSGRGSSARIAAERPRRAAAPVRAPALASPEPRHLVGRLGGARRGGRAPRRRQRASSGRRGRSSRPCRGGWPTLQTELTQREEALRFLSDPNVRYVSLGGLKPTPEASAWLLWNPATRQGLLLARGLPAAPAGHAYELWALAGAQPVPGGRVLASDAAGRALLRLPPLPEGHTFDAFAVTLEPAPGVPKPTGPMHLHGKVL